MHGGEGPELKPLDPRLNQRANQRSGASDHGSGYGFGDAQRMGLSMPTGNDPASIRARVEAMEMLLERSFTLPGVNIPIGLDALIGLIPVLGDIITTAMGAYIVWEGRNLGMSKWQLTRMSTNVAVDTALGLVPIIGDAADFVFRSNSRNLRIIKKHLDKHHPETRVIEG